MTKVLSDTLHIMALPRLKKQQQKNAINNHKSPHMHTNNLRLHIRITIVSSITCCCRFPAALTNLITINFIYSVRSHNNSLHFTRALRFVVWLHFPFPLHLACNLVFLPFVDWRLSTGIPCCIPIHSIGRFFFIPWCSSALQI